VKCPWTSCSWTTARAMPRPRSAASTERAFTRWSTPVGSAPPSGRASRSPETRAMRQPCTSTATASTTRPTSSGCSSRSFAGGRTTCSGRASSAVARACRGTGRSRTARPVRCSASCSAPSRATPRPVTARSLPGRSPPPASATTTTTPRCSRSPSGAPASTRWRSRSATAAARMGARSCATPSTSHGWGLPSGASGAPRVPRAGRAAARLRPPRPPARTASHHRARTGAAGP